jgi:hypothetical protein
MSAPVIPADVRRFILTSIPSVPHLEALLLLRQGAHRGWTSAQLAERLYVSEPIATAMLSDLHAAGFIAQAGADAAAFRFDPPRDELVAMVAQLDEVYSRNLVAVTSLIHSKDERRAQQFADAFRLRKDP